MKKSILPNDCSKEQINKSFSKMLQGKLKPARVMARTKTEALKKAEDFFKKNPRQEKVEMIFEVDDILGMDPGAVSATLEMPGRLQ